MSFVCLSVACDGRGEALYFFEASCEHGPFLSDQDHARLSEYEAFGVDVYWVSGLNGRLMVHTMRDGKGYFVVPERLADFHKSMLFAFYGSNKVLSEKGNQRLGALMDALIRFWGKRIGIVTGGDSGVMQQANTMARERGILSGANFLDITDQPMTTDVDFCQVFQSTCRHSRQKWFEIASFPIFNVGGLGSLEELGITLCNMKLSISDPVPEAQQQKALSGLPPGLLPEMAQEALNHYNKALEYLNGANWSKYGDELNEIKRILQDMTRSPSGHPARSSRVDPAASDPWKGGRALSGTGHSRVRTR